MKFSHQLNDQILELGLSGDLIGESNGLDIIELVNNYIKDNIKLCLVDISGLRYINSSGIGVLITVLTKFRNKGGEVCLLNPSENVKKLLIITKLNAIFNVTNSKEDALDILKNSL
ncbi:STAS domain-containing protein [Fulvivirga sp. M361]|uniref:STAS domain-containing protein n=1 Tax=Fulvivirga sp. M361 TaxID=2594266 RepID=UPI00117BD560|nr:STAS domain-containing protein [Fulvivirga sp. M361]TRX49180.1 STAS domain-containing protein [Fulvivirga sp. M361]